ncbi:TetR family transcriptional regulator [Streptomyces sp. AC495_CC817]|uniref:TetR family transcriptional regulator n=1 Tax=Streptomyces sp. AC495_CC817 TaxID=2823900 RepID=UPI001C26A6FA|nr:TetR family transcriptional regulator [Streptomyces sp. AC495_CC817]
MAKQQRSEETRQALIASGARVFAKTPFDKARIADVLEPLGLTQGAFYFHFANKHELALEIIKTELSLMVELAEQGASSAPDPLTGLHGMSLALARLVQTDVRVQAGLRLTAHSPGEFPEFLGASFGVWESTISRSLEGAQADGLVSRDLDLGAAARFIVATFVGVQEISAISADWTDLEARIDEVAALSIRAIATDAGMKLYTSRRAVSATIS